MSQRPLAVLSVLIISCSLSACADREGDTYISNQSETPSSIAASTVYSAVIGTPGSQTEPSSGFVEAFTFELRGLKDLITSEFHFKVETTGGLIVSQAFLKEEDALGRQFDINRNGILTNGNGTLKIVTDNDFVTFQGNVHRFRLFLQIMNAPKDSTLLISLVNVVGRSFEGSSLEDLPSKRFIVGPTLVSNPVLSTRVEMLSSDLLSASILDMGKITITAHESLHINTFFQGLEKTPGIEAPFIELRDQTNTIIGSADLVAQNGGFADNVKRFQFLNADIPTSISMSRNETKTYFVFVNYTEIPSGINGISKLISFTFGGTTASGRGFPNINISHPTRVAVN
ncbi:MAG: hypothetical protein P1V18_04760 [Candidatus Gracilibacteria bacterium]|nr:hypothetical protein [Candidatus Gracilibacteria bacterium]